jgi:hypothetical protein
MSHLTEEDRWSAAYYFQKRKATLIRRVSRALADLPHAVTSDEIIELCTICSLQVCMICYGSVLIFAFRSHDWWLSFSLLVDSCWGSMGPQGLEALSHGVFLMFSYRRF